MWLVIGFSHHCSHWGTLETFLLYKHHLSNFIDHIVVRIKVTEYSGLHLRLNIEKTLVALHIFGKLLTG